MNAERMHAICLALQSDFNELKILKLLEDLLNALRNLINQPQQPTHQEMLANSRKQLRENLAEAESNSFSPAWLQAIDEMGLSVHLGQKLSNKIESIFSENTITPQVALKELEKLTQDVKSTSQCIDRLVSGFYYLGIDNEVLEPGDAELGIQIPRSYLNNRFDCLSKEFKELNSMLNTISEVATGKVEHLEIRSLSTSDPFIVLGASLGTLSAIAILVKQIVSAYKEILEVRLLHAQLAERKVPVKKLSGIEEYAEEIMEKEIEKIKASLLEKYPVKDDGRKNELSNALGLALKKLANRFDRGFNIEVKVKPFESDDDESNAEENEDIQVIQSAMEEMEFMKVEGKPILNLPEKSENDD